MLTVAAVAASAAGEDRWSLAAWRYRRPVTVPPVAATRLPGDDVAYVTFFTGGLTKPDAGDIRVAAQTGQEVPSRVLNAGPGDQVTVAFALRGVGNTYDVYFGNADAAAPSAMDIRRGVLMEAWRYDGRVVRSFAQMQEVFQSPGELLGRAFRPDIFLGYNPFGPDNRLAALYAGFLVCPWSGEYIFCTSSQDASFLCVDDTLVVENGGQHGPQRRARRLGRITLESGLHKLTVYHACTGNGFPVIVAAWQPPGAMQIKPIPSSAFADVIEARPGPLQERSEGVTADFTPEHAGEAFLGPEYLQRYAFKAVTGSEMMPQVVWDFGDGQSSRKASVDHVYLADGQYTVTLTVRLGDQEYRRTNRLWVSRPWDQVTSNKLDGLKQHAAIAAEYDFAGLSDQAAETACRLFRQTERPPELVRAAEAMLGRATADPRALGAVLEMYAETLSAHGQSARAAEALLQAAEKADRPAVRANLLVSAGRLLLEASPDGDKALAAFQRAIDLLGTDQATPLLRRARIGVGDVWRARGDAQRAQAAYQAAGAAAADSPVAAAILQGDMARHVEAYLRSKELDWAEEYLNRWGETTPADKLTGYWSLLRVRVLLAQDRYGQAVAEAQTLVAVNSASPYAPQLLMLAAEGYTQMGQAERAAAAMRQLVEKYPDSALAAEAAAKIARPR